MFYYTSPKPLRANRAPIAALIAFLCLFALAGPARADRYQDYQTAVTNAEVAAQNGDASTAFCDYETALADYPSADLPKNALIALLGGLPRHMDLSLVAHLPAPIAPCSISSFTVPAGNSPAQRATLVAPASSLHLKELSDPENGWPFDHVVYVYRSDVATPDKGILLCAVHYQTDDDRKLAQRVGSLLLVLRQAYLQETGKRPVGDTRSFDVWLCRRAPETGGGEEWRGNLYYYNTADNRSSIEWIREIAHEYSHLAFAAIGGSYTQPEAWANGYIGERILVRWLARGAGGGPAMVEQVWGTFSGYPNFARLLVTPEETLYETQGPSEAWLARRDAVGMNYVIGFLLWVDDNQGSRFLGDLLATMTARHETSPESLYTLEVAMSRSHKRPPSGVQTTSGREYHQSA